MVTVRNKFDTLQEISLNDKYENFVTTNMKAAAECIPVKPKVEFIKGH